MVLKHDQIASQCSLPSSPLSPPVFSLDKLQKKLQPLCRRWLSRITTRADNKGHAVVGGDIKASPAQPFDLFRQVPWWETSSPWYPASCTGTRLFKVMRQILGQKQPLQISLFFSLNVLRFRRALNFALCLCIHIFLRKLMIYSSLIPLYLQASMNFIN